MKTLQTPVKWSIGFEGTKHTFTGYKSKTVTDTLLDFSDWYYRNHFHYKDFGHAFESYMKTGRLNALPKELKMLRHNMIERIKVYHWSQDPSLEYFQLTEAVNRLIKVSATTQVCFFIRECARSSVKNDTPLTTPTTNDNIGFV